MTKTAAPALRPYYVSNSLVMAYNENDAIRKAHSIAVANITDYPHIDPTQTVDKLQIPTTATLKD